MSLLITGRRGGRSSSVGLAIRLARRQPHVAVVRAAITTTTPVTAITKSTSTASIAPMRIAFATCAAHSEGLPDDRQVAEIVGADFHVWDDQAVDWSAYDRVVIRSTWDYSHRVGEFVEWCRSVGSERLRNVTELVAFNVDKRYLAVLNAPTAPTSFLEPGDEMPEYDHEVVIKPNISAGARNTGRFQPDAADQAAALVAIIHASGRTALIQPYLAGVDEQGETGVVFLGGIRSHVLRKRPVLRTAGIAPLADTAHAPAAVMLEQDLVSASTATVAELALADAVHTEVTDRFGTPLYARVDMIPGPEGEPVLLELEVIEPNLHLDLVPGAVERLAVAILAS